MRDGYRILDFRNRPPIDGYAALFEHKRQLLGNPWKRTGLELWFRWLTKSPVWSSNPGAAILTPSMRSAPSPASVDLWWSEMAAAGIDAVVSPGRLSDDRGDVASETLAEWQRNAPGRFYGLATIDLDQSPTSIADQAEHAVKGLGLPGVNIEPAIRKALGPTHVADPHFHALYEAMSALGAPVMVYTSPFAGPTIDTANDMGPYAQALSAFPRLKLVLGHGGYPRVKQVVATARRHPNLFICQDIYSFWPGGETYLQSLTELQDQYLFGSSYPFSSMAEPLEATLRLPISAAVMEKYLWGNGARLLGLQP